MQSISPLLFVEKRKILWKSYKTVNITAAQEKRGIFLDLRGKMV